MKSGFSYMQFLKSNNILIIFVITLLSGICLLTVSVKAANLSYLSGNSNQIEFQTKKEDEKYREIERVCNQILRGSIELYKEGSYWSCARELIILMDYYPEYEKLDEVVFYLAQCLFEEDLLTSAVRMYKYLLNKFPQSSCVPATLLGLEKTYYQQNDYKLALSVYFTLLKKAPYEKELLAAAHYYAGQSHFHLKNYDMAINVLKKIDNHSDYYDCALYTTALSNLKKSNVTIAIDYFRKIISLPVISGERRNIIDNARLTLGYIYYELKAYEPAKRLLLDISEKHEHYQDALLAAGWSFLKMDDHQNVIKYLKNLIKLFPESPNAEEAHFLLGQSYIALGEYDNAIESYQTIVEFYKDKVHLPNILKKVSNSLDQEEDRVERLKVKVLIEETRLLDAISINGNGEEIPKHLVEEKKKLKEFRENLINNLLAERDNLLLMQENIYRLKQLTERSERRKDWRGYAEYGISRALFLKNMKISRGN